MKGLYIHIPFCVKKCDYCDFVSFSGCERYFEQYINAVTAEMRKYHGERIDSIFIGGGTPSILPSELTKRLCDEVKDCFDITEDAEWTSEVNPGTVDFEKICNMRDCGINRVSIGVQSFNDKELDGVGRIHNAETAYRTVTDFGRAGFSNISLDLMVGLPYQTEESFKSTLKTAVELPINHISVYSLIIEENTPIKSKYDSGVFEEPDEETDRQLYKFTGEFLKKNGLLRYEASNYAKVGYESRHNLKYWNCDEYIGIGVSAHSYINGERFENTADLKMYMDGKGMHINGEILSKEDKLGEFMMLGLRKIDGISRNEFYRRFNAELEELYGEQIEKFLRLDLMKRTEIGYALTERGLDLMNSVLCELI